MDDIGSDSGSATAGKKSFWETLPGLLTGLAAVLSALAGLITVIYRSNPAPQATPSAAPAHVTPSSPAHQRVINISGLWRDINYGTQVRIRQSGREISSETVDPLTGRRLAVGSGRISGRSIEGPYVWMTGVRYMAYLMVSEDGQEITGTTRNQLTGQTAPAHLSR